MKASDFWLVHDRSETFRHLSVDYLVPNPSHDQDAVVDRLGHELRRNYIDPSEVAAVLEEFGAGTLADHLRNHKLPTKTFVRHGEFGEAISGALFRRARKYCVPILKLRYKQGRDQPSFLADILAFRLRANPPVVAVLEIKTYATRDKKIGVKAYEQLGKTIAGGLGQAITFTHARLSPSNPALASRIFRLLYDERFIERHVIIVHDDLTWTTDVVDGMAAMVDQEARATVILLPTLSKVVERVYEAAVRDVLQ